MMNDKELNKFTKSVIIEGDLEFPSTNFVKNVMSKVNAEVPEKVAIVYKPLISKTGWVLSISLFVLIIFAIYFSGSSTSIFSELDLSNIKKLDFSFDLPEFKFPELKISKIVTFSMVFLAIVISFQILIIQKIHSKNNSIN